MSSEDLFSRRRFIAAGSLALLAGCTGGGDGGSAGGSTSTAEDGGGSTATSTAETTTEETTKEEEKSASAAVKVGEQVSGETLSMVVLDSSTTQKLGEFTEAKSGNTFRVIRMAVKNTGKEFIDFNSFLQTRIKDGSNHVYDAAVTGTGHPIQSGSLAPGEVARGDIVFELPKNASSLTLEFDFAALDWFDFDRVSVDLSGAAAKTADLSQSLGVPVHSSGQAATHEKVGVTVHGVRTTDELGSLASADEGHEYVIPDIEITNDTGKPLTVSTLLQMRVKSGTGLAYMADIMGSSQLSKGYSEGSDIAPGESRRGELAYQVPKDAKPLYWVYDFLDLGEAKKAFWKLR